MSDDIKQHDVIVMGGGPAGISAALWSHQLGLKTVLFERENELGGQLFKIFNPITNYLGIDIKNGLELQRSFASHAEKEMVPLVLNTEVRSADAASKTVTLGQGTEHGYKALIISTGVRRRKLLVPGENEFAGRGLLDSGAKVRDDVGGKSVLIVGGGDAALENAVMLSEKAKRVTVIHRRSDLAARDEFVAKAKSRANVTFMMNTRVLSLNGDDRFREAELEDQISGKRIAVSADAILIRVGVQPNTELFQGQITLDAEQYFVVNADCETSVPGVFAIGDAASPLSPTISTAVGMGATAAKLARRICD